MKAIIDVARHGLDEALETLRQYQAGAVPDADYYIHFDSARQLLSHLTGTRMELLDRLRRTGPSNVSRLAKSAGRNYSNVHRDVAALEGLGLVERDEAGQVLVPFDVVEIHLGLAKAA